MTFESKAKSDEDTGDVEIARRRLSEIEGNPELVIRGEKLERVLTELGAFDGGPADALAFSRSGELSPSAWRKKRRITMSTMGAELIARERDRQITEEHWTAEHDDKYHGGGELAIAAAAYALNAAFQGSCHYHVLRTVDMLWGLAGWGRWNWKPKSRVRDLNRAGALIAAELDRLMRQGEGMRLYEEVRVERKGEYLPSICLSCGDVVGINGPEICPACVERRADDKRTQHRLKTWPEYFHEVVAGTKRFEIRPNDRNFQVGDSLILEEFDPRGSVEGDYTGRTCTVRVTYIYSGPWCKEGTVVLSLGSSLSLTAPLRKEGVND